MTLDFSWLWEPDKDPKGVDLLVNSGYQYALCRELLISCEHYRPSPVTVAYVDR